MPVSDKARMGAVHLTVADLDRSVAWYEPNLGLQVHGREDGVARLGAGGEDLLVLHEEPGAEPAPAHTGLFHYALLLPDRHELARWLLHAAKTRIPLTGMSDHLVSEAIYLRDPDWHGIEIYRDRPRSEWEKDGDQVRMATLPLDADDLVRSLDDPEREFERMPSGTVMGHVHLQVADVSETERFYAGEVGFDVMARYGSDATFMSAGGYHHHLGGNVWQSRGAGPPPPGSAALRSFTIVDPEAGEDRELEDPSHNRLLITSRA